MNTTRALASAVLAVLGAAVVCTASPVVHKVSDDRGNHLLSVTTEVDMSDIQTGRNLHSPDGYFLRSVTFENVQSRRAHERSLDFNQKPAGRLAFTYVDNRTNFSVIDEFDAVLFGGYYEGGDGLPDYTVRTSQGQVIALLEYEYGLSGELTAVTAKDADQTRVARLTVESTAGVSPPHGRATTAPHVVFDNQSLRFSLHQPHAAAVRCALYDLNGRVLRVLFSQKLNAGTYALDLGTLLRQQRPGIGIVALSVDGTVRAHKRLGPMRSAQAVDITGGLIVSADAFTEGGGAQGLARKLSSVPAGTSSEKTWLSPATVVEILFRNRDLCTPRRPLYASPGAMAMSPDGATLYVAQETRKRISVVNTASRIVTGEILLPNNPTGLAVSANGSELYVTCASDIWPSGYVHVIDAASALITRSIAAGHSARSPVLSPDGRRLYVCNMFDNTVGVIDLDVGLQTTVIPVVREPYRASLTPDGATLVVANAIPYERANNPDTAKITSIVSLINTQTLQVDASIPLPSGSHSLFGMAITPDGRYAFVTHLVGKFNIIADQMEGGWVHTNNCAIIDIAGKRLYNSFALDLRSSGAANPWGVAFTADGAKAVIVHSGSCELSYIDMPSLMSLAAQRNLSHDLSALAETSVRRRIPLPGKGPREVVITGHTAYVSVYFSDSVRVVDLGATVPAVIGGIGLIAPKALSSERLGERHFYDGVLCFQRWQSCNSCHPFTRPDGLNWILARMTNTPKNAKSMLYSYYTPPTGWTGRRENSWRSIEAGIEIELMLYPDPRTVGQIDSFFMALRPVPSPHLDNGRLTAAAQTGKSLYYGDRLDCIRCHYGALYSSRNLTGRFIDDREDLTTTWTVPHLIEGWRTAPYDHLGSTLTMKEIVLYPGHSGNVSRLNVGELDALVEFLISL